MYMVRSLLTKQTPVYTMCRGREPPAPLGGLDGAVEALGESAGALTEVQLFVAAESELGSIFVINAQATS